MGRMGNRPKWTVHSQTLLSKCMEDVGVIKEVFKNGYVVDDACEKLKERTDCVFKEHYETGLFTIKFLHLELLCNDLDKLEA